MQAKGTFEVTMHGEPPFDGEAGGVTLGRATIDKTFAGALAGTSKVYMLAARTPVANSAGYVAIERIDATLDGKKGTFVVMHTATMNKGERSLVITVVPDSGTGELAGIAGSMSIEIVEKQHYYTVEYTLPA